MSPVLLLVASRLNRRYIYLALATMVIVVSLPVMAVFALGSSALSFLSGTSNPTQGSGTQTVGLYQGPAVPGDTYAWGNCTYWAYYMRLQAGDPIPTTWGNAATWAPRASLDGYVVNSTPSAGAIMQTSNVNNGGLGHVAYVTAVDPMTGAWTISEMNVLGLDVVDTRTIPAANAVAYNFIHDKVTN